MELKDINSLVELFFKKFEEITSDDLKNIEKTFLVSLKTKKNMIIFFILLIRGK